MGDLILYKIKWKKLIRIIGWWRWRIITKLKV
jgi:hypothetical protein